MLLRFLDLAEVGGAIDDGIDEEETRAARLDKWITLEAEEE